MHSQHAADSPSLAAASPGAWDAALRLRLFALAITVVAAQLACAPRAPGAAARGWVPWEREGSLHWLDCAPGSTRHVRYTPADGNGAYTLRETRLAGDSRFEAELQVERLRPDGTWSEPTCCRRELARGLFRFFAPAFVEEPLRKDVVTVGGRPVPVQVSRRTTSPLVGDDVPPWCHRDVQVEEISQRREAPAAEEPVLIRLDLGRSHFSGGNIRCANPPPSAPAAADGFADVRRTLALDVPMLIDGARHRCARVLTWSPHGTPLEALECPSVLGGRARWQSTLGTLGGIDALVTKEVLSFQCVPPSEPTER